MDEDQLMQHMEKCSTEMETKQRLFEQTYTFDTSPVKWYDAGSVVFHAKGNDGVDRDFEAVFIGIHTVNDEFTWGWADERVAESIREKSAKIKGLSQVTGYDQFETPTIEMGAGNLEGVIPVVIAHLGAIYCYVDKSREPLKFFALLE